MSFITRPATAAPNLSYPIPMSTSELRTVAQIRSAAAMKTNKSVKGASPLTAMNSLRRLAEDAHIKEQQGDLKGALYQFIQVTVLLNFVTESSDYKLEAQKGRHGVLYQLMHEFLNKGPFSAMMKSVDHIQKTLLQVEEEQNALPELTTDADGSLSRRTGGSLAERLKQLQGNGIQADALGRKIQRPPSQNFRPQSPVAVPSRGPTPAPRGPTPGPYTRRASLSFVPPIPPPSPKPNGIPTSYPRPAAPPIAPGTSPRQFVPVTSFGPPSPTHSAGSSPEEDDIQIPRVRDHPIRSPSEFSRAFPPIDELNEEKSMFPSVPTHVPGSTKPVVSPTNGMNGHQPPNGLPWKKFPSVALNMEPRPASTPIPIKRLSGGSRPTTPAHLVGSPGGNGYHQQNGSPRGNGMITEPTPPRLDLPLANSITPQKLNSLLETRGLNILLLDVRHREHFDKERINHDAIVCIEPTVLARPGINSSVIEGAQVISPSTEQVLFKNRSRFDLIIMYDERSSTLGSAHSPVSALSRSIFENEFHRPLKRPPMLLIGGLKAWKEAIGEEGVLKRVSPSSSAGSLPTNGNPIPVNQTGSSTSGNSVSEEETFLYDRAEAKYPPADKIQPQHTGSDISTETPGTHKLAARRVVPKLSSLNGHATRPTNGSPAEAHAPTLVSTPGVTRNGPIQYPSFPPTTPFSPPAGYELTPPAAASVNPYPSSRKRNDFPDHAQQAYSGAVPISRPIDYPQLSSPNVLAPPPAVATAASIATNRLEPRSRFAQTPTAAYSHKMPPPAPTIPSDYPVVYWSNNEIGVSGLKNLGNTCYMNSILQCLSAAAPFSRFFIDGRWRSAVNMLNPLGTKGKFTEAYARLLVDMWKSDQGALTPVPFRKSVCVYAPQFADANQHDAQEFMIFLLDGLHEDLNRVLQRQSVETRPEREAELEVLSTQIASEQEWYLYRMTNNSIVVDYFQGQFRNRMECMTCHKTSTTYNTFMHLSLPVPDGRHISRVTLQQCLDTFVQQEVMEKNDAWNCPNCKALRKATKVLTLCRLPPILLIHLKRFSFKGPFTEKMETLVEFPLTNLDLTNYMPPPLPPGLDKNSGTLYGKPQALSSTDPRRQVPPYKYDLFGVTNHFGTLSNGHYTSFVSSAGGWKYCDDSRITRADPNGVVTKAAYVLFYKRTH